MPLNWFVYVFIRLGDTCCFPFSIGSIRKKLEATLPGVHVVSLKMGKTIVDDMENGYFMHPDKQIAYACDIIKGDTLMSNGFNAIGFSQGSQFLYVFRYCFISSSNRMN